MFNWMASHQDAIEVKIAILVRYAKASADLTEPRNRDQLFIEEKLTVDVPQTFMHKLFTLWLDFPIVSPWKKDFVVQIDREQKWMPVVAPRVAR